MGKIKQGKEIGTVFDKYDCFGQSVSSFNIEGNPQVGTSIGSFCSIFILVAVLMYATSKGRIMIFK
jgi:hypothetical protein